MCGVLVIVDEFGFQVGESEDDGEVIILVVIVGCERMS